MSIVINSIIEKSLSQHEIVLTYSDALDFLSALEAAGTPLLGWEGWLLYPDGKLGHSEEYQGTVDLSNMEYSRSIELAKSTIEESYQSWEKDSRSSDFKLVFCLTTNT